MINYKMTDLELIQVMTEETQVLGKEGGTLDRLINEYNQERKKHDISLDKSYTKCYEITTKDKNKFLFICRKATWFDKHRGLETMNYDLVSVFDSPTGLMACQIVSNQGVSLYTPTFFETYVHLTKLELPTPLDVVKRFFIHYDCMRSKPVSKLGKAYFIGSCKVGYVLGKVSDSNAILVNQTFVTGENVIANSPLLLELASDVEDIKSNSEYDYNVFSKRKKAA